MSKFNKPGDRPLRMKDFLSGGSVGAFEDFGRRPMMSHRIPIHQDDLSFEERQGKIWTDMEKDMERRRKDWEDEIENMRKDFFHLKPEENKLDSLSHRLGLQDAIQDDAKSSIEKDQNGRPIFRARFNVKDYKPEEVNVKVDNDKLIVTARHEEKGSNKTVSREFSREVNIPREADALSLGCSISSDGVLTAEAPLLTPGYQQISAPPPPPSGLRERIVPMSSSVASAAAGSPPPPAAGTAPPTHTSTFTTFMSPKGSVPAPPYSASPIAPSSATNVNTVPQSYSTSSSSSSTSKFETRSGSGSPGGSDRDKKYRVEVDIEDFSPEDLTVRTVDKTLVISARKEERIGSRSSTKELNREFNLPDTVDPMSVKAFFSDSGKLLIEAPYLKSIAVNHYSEGREGSPMTGR